MFKEEGREIVKYSVGVDVGGTFTDVVLMDNQGVSWVTKVPSTPPNFEDGFIRGVTEIVGTAGVSSGDVDRLVHGTTVATNAILERKGAKLGLVTTEGFQDILFIGKANRRSMYDLFADADEPLFLVGRENIVGAPERIDHRGAVVTELDTAELESRVELLLGSGVEALVICFLHAYANPVHEFEAKRVIEKRWPDVPVSVSCEIDPRYREYERLVVTSFDAYVRPVVVHYLTMLEGQARAQGWSAPLQIMQSRGGIAGVGNCTRRPVSTALSGPAAGVVGACRLASAAGLGDCITFDMGGTSADVALVKGGQPLVSSERTFDGFPLRIPMVDIETVGAGGGSIAWIDQGGALNVGPQSAGARPGPACYGDGGQLATVTDASVVLGYLSANSFAGGITLDTEAAAKVIQETVAGPLGLSLLEAALGIHRIANSRMAQTLRLVSIRRGEDPRRLALIAFGGAGPIHAGPLAAELVMPKILVPPAPGVASAIGLLQAPIEHEFSKTFRRASQDTSVEAVAQALSEIDDVCRELMEQEGLARDGVKITHFAQMRYVGQSYELEVHLDEQLGANSVASGVERYHRAHMKAYSYAKKGEAVEFVGLRTVHSFDVGAPNATLAERSTSPRVDRTRNACFDLKQGLIEVPVLQRQHLEVGERVQGPAIIEQSDTTTVVYPGDVAVPDDLGNLLIDVPTKHLQG